MSLLNRKLVFLTHLSLLISTLTFAHYCKLIFQEGTRTEMEMSREQLLESIEDVVGIEKKEQYEKEEEPENVVQTVFVTKSGKKYHLKTCNYVKKGAKAIRDMRLTRFVSLNIKRS